MDNARLAELLAREAENAEDKLRKALLRASRAALLWPVEAHEMVRRGEPLTELVGIGPYLQKVLLKWIKSPPATPEVPPIRQHFLTLARARGVLQLQPDWQRQYRGDLQMHSQWSDGAGTIEQMAQAGGDRGYEYIAITDHSKGLKIAGGIDEQELASQAAEIDRLNSGPLRSGACRVLKSIELNLNPRGEGDLDPAALGKLDLVVGSFHSKLREKEDQTERYLAALRNPAVNILGHPVGRIYNYRVGLKADWSRVCGEAAELDKALEVDSYVDRQDLNVELLLVAKAAGTRIAIDTDAHSPDQFMFAELGLAAALLAGIPEERIVNFMPFEHLLAWAKQSRKA